MDIASYPEQGCPGCTMFADNLPNLTHHRARMGWADWPWYTTQDRTGSWTRRHDEYTPDELAGGRTST